MRAPHVTAADCLRRLAALASRRFAGSLAAVTLSLALGCDAPAASVREWTAADHDHQSESASNDGRSTSAETAAAIGSASDAGHGVDPLVLATWKRNCTGCHGLTGAGDGPQGASLGAPNLRDPARQRARSDAELMATIRGGRGAMPAFDLPAPVLAGLVRLIRLMALAESAATAPSASGTGSAAPAASSGGVPEGSASAPDGARTPASAPASARPPSAAPSSR